MERSLHIYIYLLEIRLGFIGKVKNYFCIFKVYETEKIYYNWYNYFCN